jgi:hypothetical protein
VLVLCASLVFWGCSQQAQSRQAQAIPRFDNSSMLCRPSAYSPEVAALLPECKPDPPGRPIYQLTTTVWTGDGYDSKSLPGVPSR